MTTQSPTPTVPAQQSASVDVPPTASQPSPAAQSDTTLRTLVIGLLVSVLALTGGAAFYISLEHPSVAPALQAMCSVLGVVGLIPAIAAMLGRRR